MGVNFSKGVYVDATRPGFSSSPNRRSTMFYGGNFPLGTGLTPLHSFNPGVLELQTEVASVGRNLNASV